ncbi:MAG: serine/threonine protein kinase, partial [Phototrophicales bacterium]
MDVLGLSGKTIKSYQINKLIGEGGYGVVYRAEQKAVLREVAIKVILPRYANSPEFIRRFESEAQVVARLEHPHIVPLYDFWREPNSAFLVMRYLRGGSLRDRIDEHGALRPE